MSYYQNIVASYNESKHRKLIMVYAIPVPPLSVYSINGMPMTIDYVYDCKRCGYRFLSYRRNDCPRCEL